MISSLLHVVMKSWYGDSFFISQKSLDFSGSASAHSISILISFASFASMAYIGLVLIPREARHNGFITPQSVSFDEAVSAFDGRWGYSVGDAVYLLRNWGHTARMNYLIFEFIDLLLFIPSARTVSLVTSNYLLSTCVNFASFSHWFKWLAIIPAVGFHFDVLEDFGQMTFTYLYDQDASVAESQLWTVLVYVSSAANLAKYICLSSFGVIVVIAGIHYTAYSVPYLSKKNR
jgi:hypothetical protein